MASLDSIAVSLMVLGYLFTSDSFERQVDHRLETLPKALRTQALTALTSNFGLVGLVKWVWLGRFGLVGLVW